MFPMLSHCVVNVSDTVWLLACVVFVLCVISSNVSTGFWSPGKHRPLFARRKLYERHRVLMQVGAGLTTRLELFFQFLSIRFNHPFRRSY